MAEYKILTNEFDPQSFFVEYQKRFADYEGVAQISLVDRSKGLHTTEERLHLVRVTKVHDMLVRASCIDQAEAIAIGDQTGAWSTVISTNVTAKFLGEDKDNA